LIAFFSALSSAGIHYFFLKKDAGLQTKTLAFYRDTSNNKRGQLYVQTMKCFLVDKQQHHKYYNKQLPFFQ